MRAWVEMQTHHPLGYVEQLYTFADRDRSNEAGARVISVSYLGLTREAGVIVDGPDRGVQLRERQAAVREAFVEIVGPVVRCAE